MTHRERILTAARRGKPDRIPLDLWAIPEVYEKLFQHFGVTTQKEVWERLRLDKIIGVGPRYVGPPGRDLPGGLKQVPPFWNIVREVPYGTGVYHETVDWPLKDAATIAELERFDWPSADWYDFSDIAAECDKRLVDQRGELSKMVQADPKTVHHRHV